ncbi:MAG: hypothetical protein IJQ61_09280, partial [Bacteroidales bacterium]|nr:hypothetical protein [Bacteroidales bacterium]
LRDIETTLNLCGDLYRSGLKVMPRSTLAEANEKKDWRIYQDFAMTLVKEATALYKYFQMKGAYFVTRAKDNMSYEVIESRPVSIGSGVLSLW